MFTQEERKEEETEVVNFPQNPQREGRRGRQAFITRPQPGKLASHNDMDGSLSPVSWGLP